MGKKRNRQGKDVPNQEQAGAADLVSGGIETLAADALGHSFLDRWAEATLSGIVTAPLFALPVVALYFALAELEGAAPTSSGTVTKL